MRWVPSKPRGSIRGAILVLGIGLPLGSVPTVSAAQEVTLPTARVGGPSPQVLQLLRMLDDARTWYDSAKSPVKYRMLQYARARLLLAPLTEKQLETLKDSPTSTDVWLEVYSGELHGADRDAVAAALKLAEEYRQRAESSKPEKADTAQWLAAVQRSSALLAKAISGDTTATEVEPAQVKTVSEAGAILVVQPLRDREESEVLRSRLDSLARLGRLVVIQRKIAQRWLAPVRSHEQAMVFWQQQGISPLNIGSITGGSKSGSAFTEFASPLLHAVRVSLNTVIAAASETAASSGGTPPGDGSSSGAPAASETAETRFVNGGGLLNVAFAWPAMHWGRSSGSVDALLLLVPRIGATLPALGAVSRDSTLFVDNGAELHLKSTDVAGGVGLFLQVRGAHADGTDKFGALLGTRNGANHFWYTSVAAGLVLGDRYLLSGGKVIAGPRSLRDLGWQVGITAVRGGAQMTGQ